MIGPRRPTWQLFWVSFLALFLELLLIRWVATEVRIFAYLQNTVLVVCFLGLGMGCFTSRRPAELYRVLLPLAVFIVLLTVPATRSGFAGISEMLSVIGDPLIWYEQEAQSATQRVISVSLGLLLTLAMMALLWAVFLPLGRLLGRLLDEHPHPIRAYTVNVFGSLLGTWLFTLLSALHQPPLTWFLVACAMAVLLVGDNPRQRYFELALLLIIVVAAAFTGRDADAVETIWSPYQKLAFKQATTEHTVDYWLSVNNVDYQGLLDLSDDYLAQHPDRFPPGLHGYSQYDIPLLLHPSPERVLLVGAGAGNDAAGAVRNGAGSITAVEIDPVIVSLGRRYHPEAPYAQSNVRVVVDDARSFFASSGDEFDLIVFGLLDSHTTHAMTNARLDHYVYTRESIARARELLADHGVMVLMFEAQKEYIADRMGNVLREEFLSEPLVMRIPMSNLGWGGVMFVAGEAAALEAVDRQLSRDAKLATIVSGWQDAMPYELTYTTPITTDDWPYLYLPQRGIPTLYYLLNGLIVLLFLFGARLSGSGLLVFQWGRSQWHFFALGAGFLLLEVQNISKACVALGNTWWVNTVIISGLLIMVLLANLLVWRFPRIPIVPVLTALVGTCIALYFLDLSVFAGLPFWPKALLVGGVTTLPMLFSGIVFIYSFSRSPNKDRALGANLVGALVGGLLQSLTFLTGVKFLLIVVAAFYGIVWATRPNGK